MSKAISTTTTAALGTTPVLPPSSRRHLLAGSGLTAALATIGLTTAATASAAQPDPILAIYAEWRGLEDEHAIVERQHTMLRGDFVRLYGEFQPNDAQAWNSDPRQAELSRLTERSNELLDLEVDQLDALRETPATSLEGIRCKLLAAVKVHSFVERRDDEPEFHDELSLSAMREAVRMLGGSMAA